MSGTEQENTRWIEVWALNDPAYYDDAVAKAQDGPDALREFVTDTLQNAPAKSGAWYTGKEMTSSDYDKVNWVEVAETLTS